MSLWSWLGKIFHTIKVTVSPVVVSILEVIQGAENSGLLDGISKAIDSITHSQLAEEANAALKKAVVAGIAVNLAIEGLPDNPTADDIKTFETNVENALISKKAQQSVPGQVISNLGVQIFTIVQNAVQSANTTEGGGLSFAKIAEAIEAAWEDYQNDLANAQAAASTQE